MRAKNREVNIFNMSLLDILCGALGAFCFMMLVLFPYWKPKGSTAEDIERRYQSTMRELEEVKKKLARMPDSADLQRRIDRIAREYGSQKAELEKARREAEQAKEENSELRMRRPMVVTLTWASASHEVDLYVRSRGKTVSGKTAPMPEPTQKQGPFFDGDKFTNSDGGPGTDVWMVRDVPLGSEFEVYYKFLDAKGNPGPASITSADVNHEGGFWNLPPVQIPKPGTVVFAGVIAFSPQGKLTFRPQPEYAAVFEQLNKHRLSPQPEPARK
jgi:hypothetical protein